MLDFLAFLLYMKANRVYFGNSKGDSVDGGQSLKDDNI